MPQPGRTSGLTAFEILTFALTILGFYFPVLWGVFPSFFFDVQLTQRGLEALPGILPESLAASATVVLVVFAFAPIRLCYSWLDLTIRVHQFEVKFNERWSTFLSKLEYGEVEAMNRALRRWPGTPRWRPKKPESRG